MRQLLFYMHGEKKSSKNQSQKLISDSKYGKQRVHKPPARQHNQSGNQSDRGAGPNSLNPTGLDQDESSDSGVDETNLLIGRILKNNLDFGSTANFWSKSRAGKSNETSDRHRSLGNDCLKTGHFKGAIDEYNKV